MLEIPPTPQSHPWSMSLEFCIEPSQHNYTNVCRWAGPIKSLCSFWDHLTSVQNVHVYEKVTCKRNCYETPNPPRLPTCTNTHTPMEETMLYFIKNDKKLFIYNKKLIYLLLTNLSVSRNSRTSFGRSSANVDSSVSKYASKAWRLFSTYSGWRKPKYFFGGIRERSTPWFFTSYVYWRIKHKIM